MIEITLLTTAVHLLVNAAVAKALDSVQGHVQNRLEFLRLAMRESKTLLDETGVSARLAVVKEKYARLNNAYLSSAHVVHEVTPQEQKRMKEHGEIIRLRKKEIRMPPVEKKAEFIESLMEKARDDAFNGLSKKESKVPCHRLVEFASDDHRNWLMNIAPGKDIVSVAGAGQDASKMYTAAATTMEERRAIIAARMGPNANKLGPKPKKPDLDALRAVATLSHLETLQDRHNPLVFYHCDEEACSFRLLTKSAVSSSPQGHPDTHPILKVQVTFLHDLPLEYLAEFQDQGIKSRPASQILASDPDLLEFMNATVKTDPLVFLDEKGQDQEYDRLAAIDCVLKIDAPMITETINWTQKLSVFADILKGESQELIHFPCYRCGKILYVTSITKQATHDCGPTKAFKSKPTTVGKRSTCFANLPPLYKLNLFRQLLSSNLKTSQYVYLFLCDYSPF